MILSLICICPYIGFSGNSPGNPVFAKADSLFEAGLFYRASIAYERVAFVSAEKAVRAKAILRKAQSLKQLTAYDEALFSLRRVRFNGLSDTLVYSVRYEKALLAYLTQDFAFAESQLVQLHYFVKDSSLTHNSRVLYALVLNEQMKWDMAKEMLRTFIVAEPLPDSTKARLLTQLSSEYMEEDFPRLKSLDKAQKLSTVMPGTGQMYAGYFWDGAANSSLVLGALAFTVGAVYLKYYITALTVGYGLFGRFYNGGITHLEYLVEKKNHELLRAFNDDRKNFILSFGAARL